MGLYALRVGINAYHQPGVEAGKRAAATVIGAKRALLAVLDAEPATAAALAARAGVPDGDTAWQLLSRLARNERGVEVERGAGPATDVFWRAGAGGGSL